MYLQVFIAFLTICFSQSLTELVFVFRQQLFASWSQGNCWSTTPSSRKFSAKARLVFEIQSRWINLGNKGRGQWEGNGFCTLEFSRSGLLYCVFFISCRIHVSCFRRALPRPSPLSRSALRCWSTSNTSKEPRTPQTNIPMWHRLYRHSRELSSFWRQDSWPFFAICPLSGMRHREICIATPVCLLLVCR